MRSLTTLNLYPKILDPYKLNPESFKPCHVQTLLALQLHRTIWRDEAAAEFAVRSSLLRALRVRTLFLNSTMPALLFGSAVSSLWSVLS